MGSPKLLDITGRAALDDLNPAATVGMSLVPLAACGDLIVSLPQGDFAPETPPIGTGRGCHGEVTSLTTVATPLLLCSSAGAVN